MTKTVHSKTNHAYHQIKTLITRGEFEPGERLTETRLANLIGVSRGPIRESLLRLQNDGYLRSPSGRKGWYVDYYEEVDPHVILKRYEVREFIEGAAARFAALNLTGRDIVELRTLAKAVEAAEESGDRDERFNANLRFHEILVTRCGNSLLLQMYTQGGLAPVVNHASAEVMRVEQSANLKQPTLTDVVDAIASHDPDLAEQTMRRRVAAIIAAIREVIDQ